MDKMQFSNEHNDGKDIEFHEVLEALTLLFMVN
jgi:hypothetical protein